MLFSRATTVVYGIGTDIVSVTRIQAGLDRYGERFARRVLTADELREFLVCRRQAHFLARRFAAKEAAVKALGTGFSNGIGLSQIGVAHAPGGQPQLQYYGKAAEWTQRVHIVASHLSIADEMAYAVAFVVLLRQALPLG